MSPLNVGVHFDTKQPGAAFMGLTNSRRTKVFISYSHQDEKWLRRLQVHLRPLAHEYRIEVWDDTRISPGTKWLGEIEESINAALVAVLLISPDFLASDFIRDNELSRLLKAADEDGAAVIPLIISASRFERVKELSQYQSINPPSAPLNKMSDGEVDEQLNKLAQSIEDLLNEKLPEHAVAEGRLSILLNRAENHRQAGRFLEAVENSSLILKDAPRNVTALLTRAMAYTGLYGKQAEVVSDAQEVLRLTSYNHSTTGLAQRAEAHNLLGSYEDSIRCATLALDLDPQNIQALKTRAASYLRVRDYDKVITDATHVLAIEPWSGSALRLRATAYLEQGRNKEAVQDATAALHLAPGFWIALDIRASAYSKLGETAEAIRDLTDLLALAPWYVSARKSRTAIYCDTRQYRKAIIDATEALKFESNNSLLLCMRADAKFNLGLIKEAREDAEEALRIAPTDEVAREIFKQVVGEKNI